MMPTKAARSLVKFVLRVIFLMGLAGFISPKTVIEPMAHLITPLGLYMAGAFRLVFGVALYHMAPSARAPMLVRALGIFVFIAGLVTILMKVSSALSIFNLWVNLGPVASRSTAVVIMAIATAVWYVTFSPRPEQAA